MIKNILFTIAAILFFVNPVMAVDLTITCDNDKCETVPGGEAALFAEYEFPNYDIKPGDIIKRQITVKNDNTENCNLYLKIKNTVRPLIYSLDEVMDTVIKDGVEEYYGKASDTGGATGDKTLNDLYSDGVIYLGTITPGLSRVYDWIVSIDPKVGNEYQKAKTKFDFDLTFECGNPFTPIPTTSPSPSSSPNPASSPGPTGGGVGGASVCTDPTPSSAPVLTAVSGADPGTVVLSWSRVTPVTHYMIWYGTTAGEYLYGNNNAGNVNSYTVRGLGGGTYYFQVAGVNGCAPGPWSNEATPGTVAGLASENIAEEFQVLGETTEAIKQEIKPLVLGSGDIAGAQTECCQRIEPLWWIVLMIQTLFLVRYFMQRIKNIDKGRWWLVSLAVAILGILIHWLGHPWFINRAYQESPYCDWMWLISPILSLLLAMVFRFVYKEEHE